MFFPAPSTSVAMVCLFCSCLSSFRPIFRSTALLLKSPFFEADKKHGKVMCLMYVSDYHIVKQIKPCYYLKKRRLFTIQTCNKNGTNRYKKKSIKFKQPLCRKRVNAKPLSDSHASRRLQLGAKGNGFGDPLGPGMDEKRNDKTETPNYRYISKTKKILYESL